MSGEPPTEPRRYLFEVRLLLAGESKIVRVRDTDADSARATLKAHYPGWQPVETTQWAGDTWVGPTASA